MNPPDAAEGNMEDSEPPVAELMQGDLDGARREQYFDDLARCTEVREVLVRHRPGEQVGDGGGTTLEMAREDVARGAVSGVQVRYLYDGIEWLDTLLVRGGGGRLVRMQVSPTGWGEAKIG